MVGVGIGTSAPPSAGSITAAAGLLESSTGSPEVGGAEIGTASPGCGVGFDVVALTVAGGGASVVLVVASVVVVVDSVVVVVGRVVVVVDVVVGEGSYCASAVPAKRSIPTAVAAPNAPSDRFICSPFPARPAAAIG
jgi:hypothetical protein